MTTVRAENVSEIDEKLPQGKHRRLATARLWQSGSLRDRRMATAAATTPSAKTVASNHGGDRKTTHASNQASSQMRTPTAAGRRLRYREMRSRTSINQALRGSCRFRRRADHIRRCLFFLADAELLDGVRCCRGGN